MFGLIVVVVVLVASIALAILASKVWHWAHVLVVFGLVLATIGYTNLGYRVLAHRAKNQEAESKSLAQLEDVQQQIDAIDRGTGDATMVNRLAEPLGLSEDATRVKSLGDLEQELRLQNRAIGRLWNNVRPLGAPDAQTQNVEVGVAEDAPPMNANQGAILYAFEQGDPSEGARYIGEFRVVQAAPRRLTLEPVLTLHSDDLARYQESAQDGRAWVLHETMPVDTYKMFAGMTEEQLRALLPEASVQEYIRHGGPTEPDDDPRRVMGYDQNDNLVGPEQIDEAQRRVYFRQLRDYAFEFQEHAARQQELRGELASVASNLALTQEALAGAERLGEYRREEQRRLKHDLEGVTRDQQAAEAFLARVQQQLERVQTLLTQTLAANARSARQIADAQARLAGSPGLDTDPTPSRGAVDQHAL